MQSPTNRKMSERVRRSETPFVHCTHPDPLAEVTCHTRAKDGGNGEVCLGGQGTHGSDTILLARRRQDNDKGKDAFFSTSTDAVWAWCPGHR